MADVVDAFLLLFVQGYHLVVSLLVVVLFVDAGHASDSQATNVDDASISEEVKSRSSPSAMVPIIEMQTFVNTMQHLEIGIIHGNLKKRHYLQFEEIVARLVIATNKDGRYRDRDFPGVILVECA